MPNYRSTRHASISRLCQCAVFTALICVSTFISIPLPFGYFNIGDVMLLLCAQSLSPAYGAVAAALGSGLADLVMGFTLYIPATVIIKPLMSLCAYLVLSLMKRAFGSPRADVPSRLISALCAEAIMVLGYFLYEYLLYGGGALASVLGNLLQGACAVIAATVLGRIFEARRVRGRFSKR